MGLKGKLLLTAAPFSIGASSIYKIDSLCNATVWAMQTDFTLHSKQVIIQSFIHACLQYMCLSPEGYRKTNTALSRILYEMLSCLPV